MEERSSQPASDVRSAAPSPSGLEAPRPASPIPWTLLGGGLAFVLALGFWVTRNQGPDTPAAPLPPVQPVQAKNGPKSPLPKKQRGDDTEKKEEGGTFLETFGKDAPEDKSGKGVLGDADLEKGFQALIEIKDRLKALAERARRWQDKAPEKELREALAEKDRLVARMDEGLASFEKELKQARAARPDDAVPAWLTGELLILIGGEPTEISPHLRRALKRGLARPRVHASLARALTESNQPEEAFRSATKALDLDGKDRYAWEAFTRAAFNTERFAEVVARLDRAFSGKRPDWADALRTDAVAWLARWQAEQQLRRAEEQADDLPRVRLLIEHRRFARDARGVALTKVESTGRGEVILELFEDQAPATVANFLALVSQKVYDGTRFHLSAAAKVVAGGDPQSKTGDPADDGTGGPGYVIPDEFRRPNARGHFRGSVSMVNTGPGTAGSQFFLTFVPIHEMDGHFTVFGRVLKGQEVVDRITLGRTNLEVGRSGRIVPGDLLVRAEVVRKRAHEYKVIKAPAK